MELVSLKKNTDDPDDRNLRTLFLGAVEDTRNSLSQEGHATMDNTVITAIYTWYNFVPKNLWKQFQRIPNCYFLGISVLQCISVISLTNGVPTQLTVLIPLLLITAILDLNEDLKRKKADHQENTSSAHRISISSGSVSDVKWSQLTVGDVIEVRNRELIPADITLLASSDANGLCYVMTANLDGETNLKLKQVHREMNKRPYGVGCLLKCERPNNRLNTFEGTFVDVDQNSTPLSSTNVLLRGTQLRNTDHVVGLVTFVGRETKIQMNATTTPLKMSSMTRLLNIETAYIFMLDVAFCLICATAASLYSQRHVVKNAEYIWGTDAPYGGGKAFLLSFFSSILIFANFVPISHGVQLALCKLIQAKMMTFDLSCYWEIDDGRGEISSLPMEARSSELNEELGMIEYVFTDKTGTLTCNVMDFRKCSVHGVSYGLGTTEIGRAYRARNNLPIPHEPVRPIGEPKTPYVNFIDPSMSSIVKDKHNPLFPLMRSFFLSLALNHEVMPEDVNGDIVLSASNPDEAALVYAAKHFGLSFLKRERGDHEVVTIQIDGAMVSFTLLHNLEFSSERKRSSAIVRMADGTIMLFTKGADNVILERLSKDQTVNSHDMVKATEAHLVEYVNDGLRTLLVAQAVLDPDIYAGWKKRMQAAEVTLVNRMEERYKAMEEIEINLTLIGATAIEDKLQDGVGDTISALRAGGVKVWMLTGDKVGTAENIGHSCDLINKGMLALRFIGDEDGQASELRDRGNLPGLSMFSGLAKAGKHAAITAHLAALLEEARAVMRAQTSREVCLIVDTEALTGLEDAMVEDASVGHVFIELASVVKSVICARVSPKQKARIVKLVRDASPESVTLSIGDGANDVPMIQTAHVGVGIHGLEGRQAVNASDYAIGQFRFLKRLLLVHGRWNHRRCALLTNYLFYKNNLLVLPNFFFGFYSLMSGYTIYYQFFYDVYNLVFTSLPIMYVSILDQDVNAEVAMSHPSIYRDGIDRVFITHKIFWRWIFEGMYSGALIFFFPCLLLGGELLSPHGFVTGYWDFGFIVFTSNVAIVTIRLVLEVCNWTGIEVLAVLLEVAAFWVFWNFFARQINFSAGGIIFPSYNTYGTMQILTSIKTYWLVVILSTATCLVPVLTFLALGIIYNPTRSDVGREIIIAVAPVSSPASQASQAPLQTPRLVGRHPIHTSTQSNDVPPRRHEPGARAVAPSKHTLTASTRVPTGLIATNPHTSLNAHSSTQRTGRPASERTGRSSGAEVLRK